MSKIATSTLTFTSPARPSLTVSRLVEESKPQRDLYNLESNSMDPWFSAHDHSENNDLACRLLNARVWAGHE